MSNNLCILLQILISLLNFKLNAFNYKSEHLGKCY